MQILMEQVQEYFNCHLERRFWQSFSSHKQEAAVAMAEKEIFAALSDAADTSELLVFCAICEQALFLLKTGGSPVNVAEGNSSGQGNLKSETIEGLGRREYYDTSGNWNSGSILAPRAELFLARLNRRTNCSLSRG